MSEWCSDLLENFLERITYGFTNPMPTTRSGPYMITARDINHGRILYEQARSTSEEAFLHEITGKSRPDVGDVLVTKDGTLGRIAVVDRPNICINQSVALLKPSKRIRSQFLRYLLEEPGNHARMLDDADGTTIKHIYITRLAKMPVSVPSIATQDAVIGVLSAVDAKIELNRGMNETLEAMAWAVFKDWFVDFGPTRAKMAGRSAYLTPELWALIPDELDGEEKPLGWSRRPLDQIANFLNGLALQKFPPVGSDFLPVIKISQLRAGVAGDGDRASVDIPPRYIVDDGDILFSWSGSLLHRVWTGGRGALNQHLFKVTSEKFPKWLFFYWIAFHMEGFRATAASKATTMGHIQRHHLAQAMTIIPDEEVLKAAHEIIGPLFERQQSNDLEARTLIRTRDLLLPKLMSGEVRVRDAEKIAELAA